MSFRTRQRLPTTTLKHIKQAHVQAHTSATASAAAHPTPIPPKPPLLPLPSHRPPHTTSQQLELNVHPPPSTPPTPSRIHPSPKPYHRATAEPLSPKPLQPLGWLSTPFTALSRPPPSPSVLRAHNHQNITTSQLCAALCVL